MKNILIALESDRYPQEELDFLLALSARTPVQLAVSILPYADYAGLLNDSSRELSTQTANENPHYKALEECCRQAKIPVNFHLDNKDFALPVLLTESRFADLILVSAKHFFEHRDRQQPNAWMRDLLHKSECPVLLVPQKPALPMEILFAYDGSAECVYAMRQFCYLFPELDQLGATILFIDDDLAAEIPGEQQIREWCSIHFQHFQLVRLQVKGDIFYKSWFESRNKPWLIAGIKGRSGLLESVSNRFLKEIIQFRNIPLFITNG